MTSPSLQRACRRRTFARDSRRAQFEPLEDRRLLALTVITHDTADELPAWVYDMGTAVARRDGWFDARDQNTDGIADSIQNSREAWNGTPALIGTTGPIDDLLLYDWAEPSAMEGTATSNAVAGSLADAIDARLAELDAVVLDLHFIGHGRGAYVNAEVLRRLAVSANADRIGFVQMTTLDPLHLGFEGLLDADPGGLVDFADNYYQDIGEPAAEVWVLGASVSGALNFQLNPQLEAWQGRGDENPSLGSHHEVHDWYHWTIDASTVADDSPTLVDDELPVPSATERTLLYDGYEADLNNDDELDDFGGGANLGYYFSIAGGAIGNVTFRAGNVYTIDLRSGTSPLYLGFLEEDNQPNSIAYAPNGEWYYYSSDLRKLSRARTSFDAQNQPVITYSRFGNTLTSGTVGEALQFKLDGTLVMARLGGYDELSTVDGSVVDTHPVLGPNLLLQRTLAFDHKGDAYEVKATDLDLTFTLKLFKATENFTKSTELRTLPFDDIESISVVDGLLYLFRTDSYATLNLSTLQLSSEVAVAPNSFGTVASLVTLREPAWHNRDLRADINGDGRVTSSDVVAVVNTILSKGTRTIDPADLFSFHYDANNDGRVTSTDLLIVINHILQAQAPAAPLVQTEKLMQTEPAQTEPLAAPPSISAAPKNPAAARSPRLNDLVFAAALQSLEDEEEGL